MKKIGLAAVAALSLIVAAVAIAAPQVNTYSVTARTVPTKAGTTTKPVPISLTFNYKVGEQSGQRPAGVNEYRITFGGIKQDGSFLPTCSDAQIQAAQSNAPCPAKAVVGAGKINNMVGPTADPSSTAVGTTTCSLNLTLYNAPKHHATLYLESPAGTTCAGVPVKDSIDATYTYSKSKGTTLAFKVPSRLLHPASPAISNAVTNVVSNIKKITKGKKAYYSSVGGCKSGKRKVSVLFIQEDGASKTATTTAKCKK